MKPQCILKLALIGVGVYLLFFRDKNKSVDTTVKPVSTDPGGHYTDYEIIAPAQLNGISYGSRNKRNSNGIPRQTRDAIA
jgi:hypothetical protein